MARVRVRLPAVAERRKRARGSVEELPSGGAFAGVARSALVVDRAVSPRLAPAVVTVRDGEPTPDVVTNLWKDDHLPRLDLAPLAEDATAPPGAGRPTPVRFEPLAERSGSSGTRSPGRTRP